MYRSVASSYQGPLDSVLNFPLYYGLVSAFGDPDTTNMTALTLVISQSQNTFKVLKCLYFWSIHSRRFYCRTQVFSVIF